MTANHCAANEALKQAFVNALANRSQTRALKIVIENEQLVLEQQEKIGNYFEKDYKRLIPAYLKDAQPAYILIRLDNPTGRQEPVNSFVLISYTPDAAKTRDKMLASATRHTLKHAIGVQYIVDEMAANTKGEASYEAYKEHSDAKQKPGPMSQVEEGLYQVSSKVESSFEMNSVLSGALRRASRTAKGRRRPKSRRADNPRLSFSHRSQCRGRTWTVERRSSELCAIGSVYFSKNLYKCFHSQSVDTLNEAIKLENADNITPAQLQASIPTKAPRYHFYRFNHTQDGQNTSAVGKRTLYGVLFMHKKSFHSLPLLNASERLLNQGAYVVQFVQGSFPGHCGAFCATGACEEGGDRQQG